MFVICHHQWLKRNCLLFYSCQTYVNKPHTTKYVISDPCRGLYFHTPKKISWKKETVEIFLFAFKGNLGNNEATTYQKTKKQWSNYLEELQCIYIARQKHTFKAQIFLTYNQKHSRATTAILNLMYTPK